MRLTVLSIAYPLALAGPDGVGGAEQVLGFLDHALVDAGHRSIVLAPEGSRVAGVLVPVPRTMGPYDEAAVGRARVHHHRTILSALNRWSVDVVHMHGVDFHAYLPPPGVPVLVTLHGPRDWYPPEALHLERPDTWLVCVSQRQHTTMPPSPVLLEPIENGVPVDAFSTPHAKRGFALVLSRIAPDKGVHIAIDCAKRVGVPLLIAGEVFPYPEHQRYFDTAVRPRLDVLRRYIGPAGFARKRRLLAAARCLIVPSLAAETSSLVAREALAAGTPVIAFARGALVDAVENGRTGFLVHSEEEMAASIAAAGQLDPAACRRAAQERFALKPMVDRYFELYRALAGARLARRASGGIA